MLLRRWVARSSLRSSLVGREVRQETRSLFGDSTLCSMCARGQTGPEPCRFEVICIKSAYFYALVRRPMFIDIPKEDLEPGDEGCVGQLQFSLYGTRDAARHLAREYTTFLLSHGFQVERASPCNFTHQARRVHLTVHHGSGSNEKEIWTVDGRARTECWTDGRSSSFQSNHPLEKNRIGVRARSATRREDHFGVGVGNAQVRVHTSRARKRVRKR